MDRENADGEEVSFSNKVLGTKTGWKPTWDKNSISLANLFAANGPLTTLIPDSSLMLSVPAR